MADESDLSSGLIMAGYSGTPLPKKLGLKEGQTLWLIQAPSDWHSLFEELPAGASVIVETPDSASVVVGFCVTDDDLAAVWQIAPARMPQNGGLWIAWPKRSSGVPTELTENLIRDDGLSRGWVDNKVCAIDGTWSGLRFVIRVKDRA